MLPTSTVENYLKAIFQQQHAAEPGLVAMGQIASALGVTPGTATSMIKALAEAGLVQYEPYAGVKLTAAGERLAGLVLRRHRLVELFLVRVMGMRWDEVHEEAEKLEHVVSERLIERMDEMLGRPAVDPHGDPIPDAEGTIREKEHPSLLTCPLGTPVTVTRVVDQDAEFLRFIEDSNLKPGQSIEVEARDSASDSVRVRGARADPITIGARAASKLLVEVLGVVCALFLSCGTAQAQAPAPPEPFEIADNSFLVEEAFNQEAGIFQNIFGFVRASDGSWAAALTQEWPAPGQAHQLSYTLSAAHDVGTTRFAEVALNYRYQALTEGPGRPALSPRASLVVRRDDESTHLDEHAVGVQVNLPVSKQFRDFYFHGNAGLTWFPSASSALFPSLQAAPDVSIVSPFIAGSVIVRVRPMLNLMLESVGQFEEYVDAPGHTGRRGVFTISPGARGGWNIGDQQLILGMAVPIVRDDGETDTGVLGYVSWELPFRQ